jgi:hypothetical protein
MPGRSQPGRIVERACPNTHKPIPRRAGNPRPTFGANQPRVDPPAIGGALERSRLDSAETKAGLRHDDTHGESATCQALAISAVTRVDQLRGFGDLVADRSALSAAGLWKFHLSLP